LENKPSSLRYAPIMHEKEVLVRKKTQKKVPASPAERKKRIARGNTTKEF